MILEIGHSTQPQVGKFGSGVKRRRAASRGVSAIEEPTEQFSLATKLLDTRLISLMSEKSSAGENGLPNKQWRT
jgi:hypothetical protein